MSDGRRWERGYAFALPRVVARLAGHKVRRAEFSGAEAYGVGILVFGISCVWAGRALLSLVRPAPLRIIFLVLLPVGIWAAFLILYYLVSLLIALCRRLGLYSAVTNNPFQHVVIMSLTTLFALLLLRDQCVGVRSLGILWLGLLGFNLLALFCLNVMGEE
jgi:hypothetical protein